MTSIATLSVAVLALVIAMTAIARLRAAGAQSVAVHARRRRP